MPVQSPGKTFKVMKASDEAGEVTECSFTLETASTADDVANDVSQVLHYVSFWHMPLQGSHRIEITKMGSTSFPDKDGLSTATSRQAVRAEGELYQFSADWFYAVMPDGQKILQSWMVYSRVRGQLQLPTFCH